MKRNAYAFGMLSIAFLQLPAYGDWPQWRGPDRSGSAAHSPALMATLPDQGMEPAWRSEKIPAGFEGGWGCPVVKNGVVYLYTHTREKVGQTVKRKFPWLPPDKRGHLTDKAYREYEVNRRNEDEALSGAYRYLERVYAYDLESGKKQWSTERQTTYTRFLQSGTATISGDRLYVMGAARRVHCIDLKRRDYVWSIRIPGDFRDEFFMSSILVEEGVALVLCGHLVGLDAETGRVLWRGDSETTRGTHSSPVYVGGGQAVVNLQAGTTGVELHSGRILWTLASGAKASTPVVAGGKLLTYGSSRKGGLRCYDLAQNPPVELWKNGRVADPGSSPVVVGNHVIVHAEREVVCVSLKDGAGIWSEFLRLSKPRYTSPITGDGKVFYPWQGLLCYDGNASEFQELYNGKMNGDGLLAEDVVHRKLLGLEQLEAEGKRDKALGLYDREITKKGGLNCSNAALSDGRIILRTPAGLVCYDLRRQPTP